MFFCKGDVLWDVQLLRLMIVSIDYRLTTHMFAM